jgi:drug/metabolite transporter (DMT)-like permease
LVKLPPSYYPLLFLALAVNWGLAYPITKIGLAVQPPFLFAGLRGLIGGAVLVAIAMARRERAPALRANAAALVVLALLNSGFFLGLLNLGVNLVPSGLASILVYTQPLWATLLAVAWLGETLTRARLTGLLLGFAGTVTVMVQGGTARAIDPLGVAALLAAAMCWAAGSACLKRFALDVSALWLAGLQACIGSVSSLVASLFLPAQPFVFGFTLVWTLLVTALSSTVVGFMLWTYLIQRRQTSEVGAYIFLVPCFAVIFGALILGEGITGWTAAGGALVFAGIFLVNQSFARTPTKAQAG